MINCENTGIDTLFVRSPYYWVGSTFTFITAVILHGKIQQGAGSIPQILVHIIMIAQLLKICQLHIHDFRYLPKMLRWIEIW